MIIRFGLALCFLSGLALPAAADGVAPQLPNPTLPSPTLQSLALNPPPFPSLAPQQPSLWSGLYAGSDVFASVGSGKGRFGGGGFVGYAHEFPNRWVVGLQGEAGYLPSWFTQGPFKGYDFGATNVKLGYDLGRVMPYVTTGVLLARPTARVNTITAGDSVNDLFAPSAGVKAGGTVGAGIDYAVTDHLKVEVGASINNGPAAFAPGPSPGFGP
jgi:outer membrane immunogenic protein